MTIDVNAYFGNWPLWPLRKADEGSILCQMDTCGIDRAFMCSLAGVFANPAEGNALATALAARHPDRFSPAFTYSPYAAGRERYREDLAVGGPRLVKLFPFYHTYDLLAEPFIDELAAFCAERRIPIMIPYRLMMSWRLPMIDLGKVEALALRHPETRFILGSINYLAELQTATAILRRCPNTLLETSAMMGLGSIESVVANVGAGRLLHGTCLPLQNPAIGPLRIGSAQLTVTDRDRILSGNAAELIG